MKGPSLDVCVGEERSMTREKHLPGKKRSIYDAGVAHGSGVTSPHPPQPA
jgi:hypothetical protein